MKDLIIIGCGGFGREVVEYVKLINKEETTWNFLGFVDDNENASTIEGYNILGGLNELYRMVDRVYACIAIANIDARKRIAYECEQHGVHFATIVSPDIIMRGNLCTIGEGGHHCDRLRTGNQFSCGQTLHSEYRSRTWPRYDGGGFFGFDALYRCHG